MDGTGAGGRQAGWLGWSDGWLVVAGLGLGSGSALQVEGAYIEPLLWKELPCSHSSPPLLPSSHSDRFGIAQARITRVHDSTCSMKKIANATKQHYIVDNLNYR